MTCAGGGCAVTTPPCGSWLDSVFVPMLAAIGAPAPGANNLGVLHTWCPYEGTGAGYNPLAANWNISQDDCGCWNPIVNCYCSAAAGADALAGILRDSGNYPAILNALRSDAPLCAWNDATIIAEVNTWGTHGFANFLATVPSCGPSPSPTPNPCAGVHCGPCQTCTNGRCAPACSGSEICLGGVCVPRNGPGPGPGDGTAEALGLLAVAGLAGAGLWFAFGYRPAVGELVAGRLNRSGRTVIGPGAGGLPRPRAVRRRSSALATEGGLGPA